MTDCIRVVCRLRPFNEIEERNQGRLCVEAKGQSLAI
jgi:hypothetical protein